MISGINFKDHKGSRIEIDVDKILYESVDAFRYIIAIMNLWGITYDQFVDAFDDKDLYLRTRHRLERNEWDGRPVLIVDMDDVIVEFRDGFISWLRERHDIHVDPDCKEYYTTTAVKAKGLNPEKVFFDFISERQLRELHPVGDMIQILNQLHDQGYWIQLLTARPEENLLCCYDTYLWLEQSGLKYDRLDFSGEKYRWLAQSEYYDTGAIVCAIDDSPKHSAEYAKHGISVLSPEMPYNVELSYVENVFIYDSDKEVIKLIESLAAS
jgi:phosphoglycolate phosphatase-like HAD superfamily hydrolase